MDPKAPKDPEHSAGTQLAEILAKYRAGDRGLPSYDELCVIEGEFQTMLRATKLAAPEPWTDAERANFRQSMRAQVRGCSVCCVQPGDEHFPGCSKERPRAAQ